VSQAPTNTFVVDASVALKWHLNDDDDDEAAQLLLEDLTSGAVRAYAPEHLPWEAAHSLRNAARRGRMTFDQGRAALETFLEFPITYVPGERLLIASYDYAGWFGCSLYDAAYVAPADSLACPMVYADRRLQSSLAGRFRGAMRVSRYPKARKQE
jgi:predicted nucleic acid-binding protein